MASEVSFTLDPAPQRNAWQLSAGYAKFCRIFDTGTQMSNEISGVSGILDRNSPSFYAIQPDRRRC